MNTKFTTNAGETCVFTDEGIFADFKVFKMFYPYGSIYSIKWSAFDGIVIKDKAVNETGKNYSCVFRARKEDKARAQQMIQFAQEQMINAPSAKSVLTKNEPDKEYRMRCNICGKIFCYSSKDLEQNRSNETQAALSGIATIAGALGGGMYHSYEQNKIANRALDKIVDYSKCPDCHSSDIVELTDEQWEVAKSQKNTTPSAPISEADELKKFKDLLDSGVITQEEFDAKKKQILGL